MSLSQEKLEKDELKKITLLILLGPTAVGKTNISLKLADALSNLEIISADSRQIYKYMDIGTAKPDKTMLKKVKHHMIDIIEPSEDFDVMQYSKLANRLITNLLKEGKIPLIVGGSGLYISSIINPLFSGPGKDVDYRKYLEEEAKKYGREYLYEKLSKVDPASASGIKSNDLRRIIRALEVYKITGKTISYLQKEKLYKKVKFSYQIIGLKRKRENLYQRINFRVDKMIKEGFIEEVKELRAKGYDKNLNSMQGLGYKQINSYLDGEYDLETAIHLIKRDTRRYAKRQMTWFKNKIKNIQWIDLEVDSEDMATAKILKLIYKNFSPK